MPPHYGVEVLAAEGIPWLTIRYDEGAEIGYRWLARTGAKPLYAFGHGLRYTRFDYSDLTVQRWQDHHRALHRH